MKEERGIERGRAPQFRPPLAGCVGGDGRMASALNVFYCEALWGIVANVRRSLECRGKDLRGDGMFYDMAEGEMEEFRTLGELILALGGRLELCRQPSKTRLCMPCGDIPALIEQAAEAEKGRIAGYERLLSHTSDRVVHSVLTGLLARHRRNLSLLEHFNEDKHC